MSGSVHLFDLDQALRNNMVVVPDPGASGTIHFENKGFAICELVSLAAETRVLESALHYRIGHKLRVVLVTDGGNVTITGANEGAVVLADAGDFVEFVCTDANGTKQWRTNKVSLAAAASLTLPIDNSWRVWDALHTNLAGADGTDDLGLVTGTYLTSDPTFNVTVATPTSAPFYARKLIPVADLPGYVPGTDLTLQITATETVAATTANLDANIVRTGAPTVDLVDTAAQSIIGAAAAVKSFTVLGANIVAGDVLDLRVSITLNDGAATPNYSLNAVKLVYAKR
jgi:hypothetical protein